MPLLAVRAVEVVRLPFSAHGVKKGVTPTGVGGRGGKVVEAVDVTEPMEHFLVVAGTGKGSANPGLFWPGSRSRREDEKKSLSERPELRPVDGVVAVVGVVKDFS